MRCGLFAPSYYSEFECIKGECRHSCCIGWEIDIDDATMQKYASVGADIGEAIRKSICAPDGEDGCLPHFVLGEGGRCPHLDECGLCRIITELGEDHLSDICRLHPRFFNETANGREVGLGMSCEEACRIILTSDGYADILRIGEDEGEIVDFNVGDFRSEAYSILSDKNLKYSEKLSLIEKRFLVAPTLLSDGEWREVISSLEFLADTSQKRLSSYSSAICDSIWERELERALAYFIYRHASGAKSYVEFRTGLGFALFCERLLASVAQAEGISEFSDFIDLARLVSEEIEYSSDNTDALMAEIEFALHT